MTTGIIPALAGNTTSSWMRNSCGKDHPRSRGEYPMLYSEIPKASGSSPLSRGIPIKRPMTRGSRRIIPALAGNTREAHQLLWPLRDHPRSRGEYVWNSRQEDSRNGSSPLSRGIRPELRSRQTRRRIIPALAGNTWGSIRSKFGTPDHPRSRGEYPVRYGGSVFPGGSSPLSRGILTVSPEGKHDPGIIPALAGNTGDSRTYTGSWQDHPRSRGEYSETQLVSLFHEGSSPLSRGIPSGGSTILRP